MNTKQLMLRMGLGDLVSRISFKKNTGKFPDLKNPHTWSEKLFWLNKYWQPDIKALCADKFRVREYITEKGFPDILIPLLGCWKDGHDIDFKKLPQRFVLKCNHGCGMNILVENKEKFDKEEAISRLNKWMKIDYSKIQPEYHYHKIEPWIICEDFLPVNNSTEIVDYKIHCFNGQPKWIGICYERSVTGHPKEMIMSPEWKRLMYLKGDRPDDGKKMERPEALDKMLEIARKLSEDFPYVRVDLYYVKGNIFFGELTFTPSGNLPAGEYIPELDRKAGDWLDLSMVMNEK